VWQADDGGFRPWRRRVSYDRTAREVPLTEVRDRLALTTGPNWGHRLRRGLVPLTDGDVAVLRAAMTPA